MAGEDHLGRRPGPPIDGVVDGPTADIERSERAAVHIRDRHRDLGIFEEAIGQARAKLRLERANRQASGLHAADVREGEAAIDLDGVLAAQIGLIEHDDGEDILWADRVVGARRLCE